ncbi:alpha/beta hydrolase [Nocardiopsis sp. NPDC050513]|uniref:alpha/beta hydrolase n=1 Tax=Nocardiopsis sp. NPDC050513 TaxID=3364338 RepID=UPI0037933910
MADNRIVLESAAREFADAHHREPYIEELPLSEGREVLEREQSGYGVMKPDVASEWATISGGPTGQVSVRIVRPEGAGGVLPVILYLHGFGWAYGSSRTHDRLVRELATRTGAAVAFPEYDRSPEAKYPTAIEQIYTVARWVTRHGADKGLDAQRIAVCGDGVGGNMATALTLMAKERGDVRLRGQALFYPVTDADFDRDSYREFATGYLLTRHQMMWYWDQYTQDPGQRAEITASPLRASVDQLRGLPPALVITTDANVLRDEGEAYADKLREAGVPVTAVRFQGMIQDFMMVDALRDTQANRGALVLAAHFLGEVLETTAAVPRQRAEGRREAPSAGAGRPTGT